MSYYINGCKHPVFKIYHPTSHNLIDTIELPIVNSEGLIESIEEKKIVHELLTYESLEYIQGYKITWLLPYSEYANKSTMLKVQSLFRYRKGGYKLILIPRADLPRRHFEVIFSGDSIEYGIKKGGNKSIGNRLLSIQWTTKNILSDFDWIDPDTIQFFAFFNHNPFNIIEVS